MKELDNIAKAMEDVQEKKTEVNSEEKNIVESLFKLRDKVTKQIQKENIKINELESNLFDLNKTICKYMGHTFTPWEEKADKYLDRSWYYERQCTICGKKEKKDYLEQIDLEENKSR